MKNKTNQMSAKGAKLISEVVNKGVQQVKDELHDQFIDSVVKDTVSGAWSDLATLYGHSRALLLSNGMFETILTDPKVVAELTDIQRVNELVAIIGRDLTRIGNELADIYEMHKDRSGDAAIGELGAIYKITELYNTWKQRYEQVLSPNITELSALTEQAELAALMKNHPQATAANPIVTAPVEDKKEA